MTIIQQTLKHVRIGEPTSFANLTLFPLIGGAGDSSDHSTLGEAIEQGWFEVTEVSGAGSVPELKVVNKGDRAVFMLDGEELRGAKQNRVLNLTILVPPGKTLVVPVSCVEQGRWASRSTGMAASPEALYSKARSAKLAAVSGSYRRTSRPTSDQGGLWDVIAEKARVMGVRSRTGAMSDIYERHRRTVGDYERAFGPVGDQRGAVFAIGNRVVGFELFEGTELAGKMLAKVVRSYALDAIENVKAEGFPTIEDARQLLDDIAEGTTETFPAVGLGQDIRIRGSRATGAALVADDRVVHLCAFREEKSQ